MGKIPQVNGKIDGASRRLADKWRSDGETVTAKHSAQLAYYFCQPRHIFGIVIKREADPQNIAADIGHDMLPGQQVMELWCSFSTESQKARVRLIVERVEQVKIYQWPFLKKLRMESCNMF